MLKLLENKKIANFEKGPIRRSLFNNGAVSIFHEAVGFSGAKVQLHFLAGSMFESNEEEGIAHLIEHMMFKELKTEYIKELELSGATVNAYTYKENVCFEMGCLSSSLKDLLPLFFKKFLTLEFSDEELEKEKIVIVKELLEDNDDHETQAIETVFTKNFDRSVGHPIGGNAKRVARFTRKEILAYYKKYFTPSRMILSIVGGSDCRYVETFFKEAMDLNCTFKERKPYRLTSRNRIAKLSHFKSTKKRKMDNSLLVYSFDGPSINSSSFYDYAVLDELLFQGLNSFFFKKLRIEKPLVYGYGSSLNCFQSCGNYLMLFTTQKADLAKVNKVIKENLLEQRVDFIDEKEIGRIKQRILDHWQLSFDDLDERVEFLAGTEIHSLKEFRMSDVKLKIKSVSSSSVRKLLKKIVHSDYSVLKFVPLH